MMFRDIVELLQVHTADDGAGGLTESETGRVVFANQKSIRGTEFYQAHAVGLKPEINLIVRSIDYDGETRLRFGGEMYDILRKHTKNGELLELICSKRTEVIA